MFNKLVVSILSVGLLLGNLSIAVCADSNVISYIIDSNYGVKNIGTSSIDIVEAIPDSSLTVSNTRDYSARNSLAAQGGYKYTWYSTEQWVSLTNVKSGFSSWYLSNRSVDDIETVANDVAALLDNNPYYGTPKRYELDSNGRVKVYTMNVSMSFDDVNSKTQTAVEELFLQIHNDSFSDTELANRYAMELVRRADYDMDCYNYIVENSDPENIPEDMALSMLPYGVLCNGKGVCGSYAQALMLCLRRSGIKAAVDSGIDAESNNYHEWVIAELDGNWVAMDPTILEAGGSMFVLTPMPRDMNSYTFATSI